MLMTISHSDDTLCQDGPRQMTVCPGSALKPGHPIAVPCSLRGYTRLMGDAAERLVDIVAAKARAGEEVEVFRLFGQLTMEVVGSTAFGWVVPRGWRCRCAVTTAT
jgi:hypothetical protein